MHSLQVEIVSHSAQFSGQAAHKESEIAYPSSQVSQDSKEVQVAQYSGQSIHSSSKVNVQSGQVDKHPDS